MNDTLVNKAELMINALQYAHDHGLDITKREDVQKILDVLDPSHLENLDEFINLLNTSSAFMDHRAKENEDMKIKFQN